jgi:hypothetical protein
LDTCDDDTGECVHIDKMCEDDLMCTSDACNPATGICEHASVSCSDGVSLLLSYCSLPKKCVGNLCTMDLCIEGTGCVNIPFSSFVDPETCQLETCNPCTGTFSPTQDTCDDHLQCTKDTCSLGSCTNTYGAYVDPRCHDNDRHHCTQRDERCMVPGCDGETTVWTQVESGTVCGTKPMGNMCEIYKCTDNGQCQLFTLTADCSSSSSSSATTTTTTTIPTATFLVGIIFVIAQQLL